MEVAVAQHCECMKCHRVVHFKMANLGNTMETVKRSVVGGLGGGGGRTGGEHRGRFGQ